MTAQELLALCRAATPGEHQAEHGRVWTEDGECSARFEDPADAKLYAVLRNHAEAIAEAWIALEKIAKHACIGQAREGYLCTDPARSTGLPADFPRYLCYSCIARAALERLRAAGGTK